jgi:malonyl-CoA decarboxylase
MVNYLYDLAAIEANHEAFENEGTVAASKAVRALLKTPDKAAKTKAEKVKPERTKLEAVKQLALPSK